MTIFLLHESQDVEGERERERKEAAERESQSLSEMHLRGASESDWAKQERHCFQSTRCLSVPVRERWETQCSLCFFFFNNNLIKSESSQGGIATCFEQMLHKVHLNTLSLCFFFSRTAPSFLSGGNKYHHSMLPPPEGQSFTAIARHVAVDHFTWASRWKSNRINLKATLISDEFQMNWTTYCESKLSHTPDEWVKQTQFKILWPNCWVKILEPSGDWQIALNCSQYPWQWTAQEDGEYRLTQNLWSQ